MATCRESTVALLSGKVRSLLDHSFAILISSTFWSFSIDIINNNRIDAKYCQIAF